MSGISSDYTFAGDNDWRLVSVKRSCDFNPLGSAVESCTSGGGDCKSAISDDWTEAIWVFGDDEDTPWVKFTKDGSTNNQNLATLLTSGIGTFDDVTVTGFASSSDPSLTQLENLFYGANKYIRLLWANTDRQLSLSTGANDANRKCIANDCRDCSSDVLFLVRAGVSLLTSTPYKS